MCSIVLEVPDSALGANKIGLWLALWSHKWDMGSGGSWRVAFQSVFLPASKNAAYLAAEPADDTGLRRRVRPLARAQWWIYAGGSNASRGDYVAGRPLV